MSDILHQSLKELQEKAEVLGLVLFVAEPNELFVDLDEPFKKRDVETAKLCHDVLGYLSKSVGMLRSTLYTQSKSGNTHLYVKWSNDLSNMDRILIQACLGSDRRRGALSYLQELKGLEAPTALFETEEAAAKVVAWRRNGTGNAYASSQG